MSALYIALARVVVIATVAAIPFALLLVVPLGTAKGGLLTPDFASRWSGGCSGWDHPLVWFDFLAKVLTWYIYIGVGYFVVRLHPRLKRLKWSNVTIVLVMSIFVSCGATHLASAVCDFVPVYRVAILVEWIAVFIGAPGLMFLGYDLLKITKIVEGERKLLAIAKEKLNLEINQDSGHVTDSGISLGQPLDSDIHQ